MLRPILIVLHQETSTPGRIGHALRQRGYPLDVRRPRLSDPLPETMAAHTGAIIFGGPMSANDTTDFIRCEIDRLPLPKGRFYLWAGVYEHTRNGAELLPWRAVAQFDVYGPRLDEAPRAIVRLAPVQLVSNWSIEPTG